MELREALAEVSAEKYVLEDVFIRPIRDETDLWYATVECRLKPGQDDYVNPAGFSIGRAYLQPKKNVPCVICKRDGQRIGYIVLREWPGMTDSFNWSYYLDQEYQGLGFGRKAARLAIQILKAADSSRQIKLSVEVDNVKAQRLYESIDFQKLDELDGDDLMFGI